MDIEMIYREKFFSNHPVKTEPYNPSFFKWEIKTESDLFEEMRRRHHIEPFRLDESKEEELDEIRAFFLQNASTFRFLREGGRLVGSILFIDNFIQSLCVSKDFQRRGYGSRLTRSAVHSILNLGFSEVRLRVLEGNDAALKLYLKIGFEIMSKP